MGAAVGDAEEAVKPRRRTKTSDQQNLLPNGYSSRRSKRGSLFRRTSTTRVAPTLEVAATAMTSFTHEGGAGGLAKENQDAAFTAQLSPEVMVAAVFDGHGRKHGQLAARTAAAAVEAFLRRRLGELVQEPEHILRLAFADAHGAIRTAMLAGADAGTMCSVGGGDEEAFLLEWFEQEDDEEEGEGGGLSHKWDAADGGTSATVAVLLHGATLVVAAVGDSSALLLARDTAGAPVHEAVVADHAPTNAAEYERMRRHQQEQPAMATCRWVYDCPAEDEEIAIFRAAAGGGGGAELDTEAEARADAADVALKNARGERCTVVWIPETEIELPRQPELPEPQATREPFMTCTALALSLAPPPSPSRAVRAPAPVPPALRQHSRIPIPAASCRARRSA
jgi:serine/threonine protein phosphatase PrpC